MNFSSRPFGKREVAGFMVHSLHFFLLLGFGSSQIGESHEVGKSYTYPVG
jgi:hypothetical protein